MQIIIEIMIPPTQAAHTVQAVQATQAAQPVQAVQSTQAAQPVRTATTIRDTSEVIRRRIFTNFVRHAMLILSIIHRMLTSVQQAHQRVKRIVRLVVQALAPQVYGVVQQAEQETQHRPQRLQRQVPQPQQQPQYVMRGKVMC